jgi:hypothetical protein
MLFLRSRKTPATMKVAAQQKSTVA